MEYHCLWCNGHVSYFELRDNGNYEYYHCSGSCEINAIAVNVKKRILDEPMTFRRFAEMAREAHRAGKVLWVRLDNERTTPDGQIVSLEEAEARLRR